jgi:hypothetical protein
MLLLLQTAPTASAAAPLLWASDMSKLILAFNASDTPSPPPTHTLADTHTHTHSPKPTNVANSHLAWLGMDEDETAGTEISSF